MLVLLNPTFVLFLSWPWEQFLHQPQLASWGESGDGCSSVSEVQMSTRAGIANCCDSLITWTVSVGFTHGPFFILQSAVVCRQAACRWSLWFLSLVRSKPCGRYSSIQCFQEVIPKWFVLLWCLKECLLIKNTLISFTNEGTVDGWKWNMKTFYPQLAAFDIRWKEKIRINTKHYLLKVLCSK